MGLAGAAFIGLVLFFVIAIQALAIAFELTPYSPNKEKWERRFAKVLEWMAIMMT